MGNEWVTCSRRVKSCLLLCRSFVRGNKRPVTSSFFGGFRLEEWVSLLELRLVELLLSERKRNGSSLICIYKYNAASIRSSTSDQIFCTSRQLLITLITHSRRIDRKKLAQLHHRVADPSPIESERKKKRFDRSSRQHHHDHLLGSS